MGLVTTPRVATRGILECSGTVLGCGTLVTGLGGGGCFCSISCAPNWVLAPCLTAELRSVPGRIAPMFATEDADLAAPICGGLTMGVGAIRACGAGVGVDVFGGGGAFGTAPAKAIFSSSSRKAAMVFLFMTAVYHHGLDVGNRPRAETMPGACC
jgi:hypothetical protein